MPFLPVAADDEIAADAAPVAERQRAANGGVLTTFQRSLLGSGVCARAYEALDDLAAELEPYIGERALRLFSYAVSDAFCAGRSGLFADKFRQQLSAAGDDPSGAQVTETEGLLLEWGRAIGAAGSVIPAELQDRVGFKLSPKLRVLLVSYAGQLIAANAVASIAGIVTDDGPGAS